MQNYKLQLLVYVIAIQINIGGTKQLDEKSHVKCPGLYCGRVEEDGGISECKACPYSQRVNASSMCHPCSETPTFYDWLYLGFMALLSPALHCFFIDFTNKNKSVSLLVLHIAAVGECVVAAVCALLVMRPIGSITLASCRVHALSDWYTMLYNPSPDYVRTIHCTQEAVYPLYTIVIVYYVFCLTIMMLMRPMLCSHLVPRRGTRAIYAALYFFPILTVLHAMAAGLIYYAFPYIVLVISLMTSAVHMAMFDDQSRRPLVINSVTSPRHLAIILSHWALHGYAIIGITQLSQPALLALVPFPTLFYIITVTRTDPDELETV